MAIIKRFKHASSLSILFAMLLLPLCSYAFKGEYGAVNNGNNLITLYHMDRGWTGNWAYLCKDGACWPAQKENGYYYRQFNGVENELLDFQFKVQDNNIGQFILNEQVSVTNQLFSPPMQQVMESIHEIRFHKGNNPDDHLIIFFYKDDINQVALHYRIDGGDFKKKIHDGFGRLYRFDIRELILNNHIDDATVEYYFEYTSADGSTEITTRKYKHIPEKSPEADSQPIFEIINEYNVSKMQVAGDRGVSQRVRANRRFDRSQYWTFRPSEEHGYYNIINTDSKLALDVPYARLDPSQEMIVWHDRDTPNQQWQILPFYTRSFQIIENKNSVLNLAISNDDDTVTQEKYLDNRQAWHLRPVGEYIIRNKATGKVLDVRGGSIKEGEDIIQWSYHGDENQRFTFWYDAGSDNMFIKNVKSEKYLKINEKDGAIGEGLFQGEASSPGSRSFKLNSTRDGELSFYIETYPGFGSYARLDAAGNSVAFNHRNDSDTQKWYLDKQSITPESGAIPRITLFVHGYGSDMGHWRVNASNNEESWDNKPESYDNDSIPMYLARHYAAESNVSAGSNDERPTENGIEFFDGKTQDFTHEEFAKALYERIREVLNEYKEYYRYRDWENDPEAKIDLVAHSQGGIAIRKMIEMYRDPSLANPVNHINNIITMNSPHLGTSLFSEEHDSKGVDIFYDTINGKNKIEIEAETELFDIAGIGLIQVGLKNLGDTLFSDIMVTARVGFSKYNHVFNIDVQEQMTKALDRYKERYKDFDIASSELTELAESAYPTRPYDQKRIPMTLFYSRSVDNTLQTVLTEAINLTKEKLFKDLDKIVIKPSSTPQGEFTVKDLLKDEINELFSELYASFQPTLNVIDDEWLAKSDAIVDVYSQRMDGYYEDENLPIQRVELIERPSTFTLLHGYRDGLFDWFADYGLHIDGPEFHGPEVLNALTYPPQ